MKIVVLDGYTLNPGDISWKNLEKLGDVKIYDRTPSNMVVERIGDAEIVFTNKTIIDREVMTSCNIKFIGVLAAGYNVVDLVAARDLGILITNTPNYGSKGIAQMVFAHLLEITNNVALHSKSVRDGRWSESKDFCYWEKPIIDLANTTMGIIGFGSIGREVAHLAKAFGIDIIIHDKFIYDESAENVSLDELFSRSDIISLHCPLLPDTKELIREENIKKMKDGVILINTSRGPLVNESDLAAALASGKVYGAGVDVLESEPPREKNPLIEADNINITPHIAWASRASRMNIIDIATNNLKGFLGGRKENVVNR